jgi:hypothetical protein
MIGCCEVEILHQKMAGQGMNRVADVKSHILECDWWYIVWRWILSYLIHVPNLMATISNSISMSFKNCAQSNSQLFHQAISYFCYFLSFFFFLKKKKCTNLIKLLKICNVFLKLPNEAMPLSQITRNFQYTIFVPKKRKEKYT